jgi:membrane-associated protease RseP (regulator of RpoE activity)
MRGFLFFVAILLCSSTAFGQSPLEELERRLESGRLTPREPGFLGVTADDRGMEGRGLRVEVVRPGSPAETAGLRSGDVLLELERRPLRTLDDLGAILQFRAAGESVNMTFEREGERHVVTARLAARPSAAGGIAPPAAGSPPPDDVTPTPKNPDVDEESLPPPVEDVVPFPKRPASAASPRDELASLRRESAELRRRLEEVERRLAELEARLGPAPKSE